VTGQFGSIDRAVADVAAGRPVVVVDDADRENEGDLVIAAELATPELIGFFVRWTSGVLCVPLTGPTATGWRCRRCTTPTRTASRTAYTVSADARAGVTTGISAAERARTIRLLADPEAKAEDLSRPGHVCPAAGEGGRRAAPPRPHRGRGRPGPARRPAPGRGDRRAGQRRRQHAAAADLEEFAAAHGLTLISIADLVAHRMRTERQVHRVAEARLPTRHAEFTAMGYDSDLDDTSTSRWSSAISATARTCWSGCTPSA
jgi:3,4-dihydroxy 2-butanone 4-phosphate synthase/GTP cyclohydrolase II